MKCVTYIYRTDMVWKKNYIYVYYLYFNDIGVFYRKWGNEIATSARETSIHALIRRKGKFKKRYYIYSNCAQSFNRRNGSIGSGCTHIGVEEIQQSIVVRWSEPQSTEFCHKNESKKKEIKKKKRWENSSTDLFELNYITICLALIFGASLSHWKRCRRIDHANSRDRKQRWIHASYSSITFKHSCYPTPLVRCDEWHFACCCLTQ